MMYLVQQIQGDVDSSGNGRHVVVLSRVDSYLGRAVDGREVRKRQAAALVAVICGTTAGQDLRRSLQEAGAVDLGVVVSQRDYQGWKLCAGSLDVQVAGGIFIFRGCHRVPDVGRRVAGFVARCAAVHGKHGVKS